MSEKKEESALQRETRLTGNQDLVSSVDSTLQKLLGSQPNSFLARRVIGRFVRCANPQEFNESVVEYTGKIDPSMLMGLYFTLTKRCKELDDMHKLKKNLMKNSKNIFELLQNRSNFTSIDVFSS